MITNGKDIVQVEMLHASVYLVPITDGEGTPLVREIEWHNAKVKVPATNEVYCHEGVVGVPRDVAKLFVANKTARWPTKTVEMAPPELSDEDDDEPPSKPVSTTQPAQVPLVISPPQVVPTVVHVNVAPDSQAVNVVDAMS